uniref:Neurotransmitter-gated ion-channel transmembrane domain-containing protein n=1 Tax=Anabas testudineus TaxID=64144 RepID=A0A3Q1IG98_ANATE
LVMVKLDLLSFMLPIKSVDRSMFKMTLILGYTVFLLIMNNLLPITGNTIPLINVFLTLCLALMLASLLETILIANLMCGSPHDSPVPSWIRVLVLHVLGRLVLCHPLLSVPFATEVKLSSLVSGDGETSKQKGPLNEDEALEELRCLGRDLQAIRLQVEQQLSKSQGSDEWVQVGLVIDRLLFCLYTLFLLFSFITIIIFWVQSINTP